MHPDFLLTGGPVVGKKRHWGESPDDQKLGVGVLRLYVGVTELIVLRTTGLAGTAAACDRSDAERQAAKEAAPQISR